MKNFVLMLLIMGLFTVCSSKRNVEVAIDRSLAVLTWNVECGGNEPSLIASQLKVHSHFDIVGLSEVSSASFELYQSAMGNEFKSLTGTNRFNDYLQILYNANRFEVVRFKELHEYEQIKMNNGYHRSPLFVHFREKETGFEFQVVLNHLSRGNEELRKMLRAKGFASGDVLKRYPQSVLVTSILTMTSIRSQGTRRFKHSRETAYGIG